MSIQLAKTLIQQIEQIAEEEKRTPEQIIKEAMRLYIVHTKETSANSYPLSITRIGRFEQKDIGSQTGEILAAETAQQRNWSLNDFWQGADLEELANQQGVQPVNTGDELWGDFWPEDQDVANFRAAVQALRQADVNK